MSIVKQQTPYEFLVRWTNGAVAGAHIRFLERLVEDGVVISEKQGHAQPVSLAGETGFPISDVLNVVQVSALSDLKTAQDALAASEAKVASLQAQIDAYTPPAPTVDVNRIEALNGLLVLDQAGLGAGYTAWATSPDRTFAQRAFIDKAIYWRRDDPTLAAAAAAFGLTSEQVDGLFAQADQL